MDFSLLGGSGPSAALVVKTIGVAALAGLLLFFVRLYQARMTFRNLVKQHDLVRTPTIDPSLAGAFTQRARN
jgi:hypothetical protein